MEQPLPSLYNRYDPEFEKKYKVVVKCELPPDYSSMLNWIDSNSNDAVCVKFQSGLPTPYMYIGFENLDDALFFKIKFSV